MVCFIVIDFKTLYYYGAVWIVFTITSQICKLSQIIYLVNCKPHVITVLSLSKCLVTIKPFDFICSGLNLKNFEIITVFGAVVDISYRSCKDTT